MTLAKRGVYKNLLGGDMHSHERLLVHHAVVETDKKSTEIVPFPTIYHQFI